MFKGHPKGLYVLFFSNMGERFGYYTMMSIFILYLGAKFGWTKEDLGLVWAFFLGAVYFLPFFGGILADKIGYGKTVTLGIITMIAGYGLMSIPGMSPYFIFFALFVIAAGTGLFKGNLVVILGNLYEEKGLKKIHDAAFNVFYMGINIGAFFAPYAATGIRDYLLETKGLNYEAKAPGMAHEYMQGTLESTAEFETLAREMVGAEFTTLDAFAKLYTEALSSSYNMAFAIAAASIVVSLVIFTMFRKYYKHADYLQKDKKKSGEEVVELTPQQTKDRMTALFLVFAVVVFFWMAFHQNGLTLTWFAKDYTVGEVGPVTKIFFDLTAFLAVIGAVIGLVFLVGKNSMTKIRVIGLVLLAVGVGVAWWRYSGFTSEEKISPEPFQSFNPIFVVFLTPIILGIFAFLNKKGKEPSAPKKIGIGMIITAAAYIIMVAGSVGMQSPAVLKPMGGVSPVLVTPYYLIGTYFALTVAELFLSPMGLSFVAKVSPPKYRGMMQGGWLAATAVGNILSGLVAIPYAKMELWHSFALLMGFCVLSAVFMFAILKRLERATKS